MKEKVKGTLHNITSDKTIQVYWVTSFGLIGSVTEQAILIEPQNMKMWDVTFLNKGHVYHLKYDDGAEERDRREFSLFMKYAGVKSDYLDHQETIKRLYYRFDIMSNLEAIELLERIQDNPDREKIIPHRV